MNLTPYQLSKMQEMKADDFKSWLLNGFRDWFDTDTHFQSFLPVNTFSSHRDIIDQLQELYNELPEATRKEWHDGLIVAVKNCEYKDTWILSLRHILLLAHRLQVYEIIEVIRSKWIDEFLHKHISLEASRTWSAMINLLSNWSYRHEAYYLLRDLLDRSYFKNKHCLSDVPLVFIMMLKNTESIASSKEDICWLLERVRPLFREILHEKPVQEMELFLSNFAESMMYQIPLSTLINYFDQLKIDPPPDNAHLKYKYREYHLYNLKDDDKWLISALFGLDLYELDMYRIVKNNSISALKVKINIDVRILVDIFNEVEIELTEENEDFGAFYDLCNEIFTNYLEESIFILINEYNNNNFAEIKERKKNASNDIYFEQANESVLAAGIFCINHPYNIGVLV